MTLDDISVVTTSYNEIRHIDDFIRSISDRGFKQIIIMDNFSTDGTYEYLGHKDVAIYQANCNRGKGRNFAIEKAVGDYVLMVDSDNEYDFSYIDFDSMKDNNLHVILDVDDVHVWGLFAKKSILLEHPFRNVQEQDDYYYVKDHLSSIRGHGERIGHPLNKETDRTDFIFFRKFPDFVRWPLRMRSVGLSDMELLRVALKAKRVLLLFPITMAYLLIRPLWYRFGLQKLAREATQ